MRSQLPLKPDPGAVPVHLVAEGPLARPAVREAADEALGVDAVGARWRVEPVFTESDDALGGFFQVSGRLNAATLPRAAFDAAYRLEDQLSTRGNGIRVRPDLPSTIFERPYTPAEPLQRAAPLPSSNPKDWSLKAIRCSGAWQASRGAGISVGHPDTGYTIHPELDAGALDLTRDFDFVSGDDDARDPMDPLELPEGHGTRTGAVIVGRAAGEIGGVAPEATLVPIRATISVALVRGVGVARAIDHARKSGCHVVSMSLGGVLLTGALEAAVDTAVRSGMIVLAAAGNWNWAPFGWLNSAKFVVEPASYRNCIAVAASNSDSKPWDGSSRGKKVLVSAPGESVWVPSFGAGSRVTRSSGTSYGVAHTAGVAALWLARHGPAQLKQRYGAASVQNAFIRVVKEGGFNRPAGWKTGEFGVGIIDAEKVVSAPLPPDAPPARTFVEDGVALRSPRERLETVRAGRAAPVPDERVERFADEIAYLLAENPAFLVRRGSEDDAVRALLLSAGSPQLVESLE